MHTYELKRDVELFAAAIAQTRVTVEATGIGVATIIDYGGVIQKYTNDFVKIQDTYYSRSSHIFKATTAI